MDRTSSIYLNVWLKDTASFFLLSRNSFWTNSASYEYKNNSANKGAQYKEIFHNNKYEISDHSPLLSKINASKLIYFNFCHLILQEIFLNGHLLIPDTLRILQKQPNILTTQTRKDWDLSIFDDINKAAEIDIGTFYKTTWRNTKRTSTTIPQKWNYNDNTADICNLWRDYYSDLAEEKYVPGKFDDKFKQSVNNEIEHIENDINLQNKMHLKHDHVTRIDFMDQMK